jgi:SAM-dependent methyltransferase
MSIHAQVSHQGAEHIQSLCPLCQHDALTLFHQDKQRCYWQCLRCSLVSVPKGYHLEAAAEKAVYDLHDNSQADAGYQAFLGRALMPLLHRLDLDGPDAAARAEIIGLDFGCGEGAVLSQMAAGLGYRMNNYDLYYHADSSVLNQEYDFITITEVIEHVADANALLKQLASLLKPNGLMAVMTKRVLSQAAFEHWHYKADPTHICFYSEASFEWLVNQGHIAGLGHWHNAEFVEKDVVLLQRNGAINQQG